MTVWLLHLNLTPEEESCISERDSLPLPFENLPDLSMVRSEQECRHLLMALVPDAAPETVTRQLERVWSLYGGLHEEDIIAVPLPHRQEVGLAEITGRYRYQAEDSRPHTVPVKWHGKRVPFSAFRKQQDVLKPGREQMHEIQSAQMRVIIRDRLPHGYNRFVRWKWILIIFFGLQVFMLVLRMAHRM